MNGQPIRNTVQLLYYKLLLVCRFFPSLFIVIHYSTCIYIRCVATLHDYYVSACQFNGAYMLLVTGHTADIIVYTHVVLCGNRLIIIQGRISLYYYYHYYHRYTVFNCGCFHSAIDSLNNIDIQYI